MFIWREAVALDDSTAEKVSTSSIMGWHDAYCDVLYYFDQFVQGCDLWPAGQNFTTGQLVYDLGQARIFGWIFWSCQAWVSHLMVKESYYYCSLAQILIKSCPQSSKKKKGFWPCWPIFFRHQPLPLWPGTSDVFQLYPLALWRVMAKLIKMVQ